MQVPIHQLVRIMLNCVFYFTTDKGGEVWRKLVTFADIMKTNLRKLSRLGLTHIWLAKQPVAKDKKENIAQKTTMLLVILSLTNWHNRFTFELDEKCTICTWSTIIYHSHRERSLLIAWFEPNITVVYLFNWLLLR